MKITLTLSDREKEMSVTRQGDAFHVAVDGHSHVLSLLHREGPYAIFAYTDADGRQRLLRVAAHAQGDERQLWYRGRTLQLRRIDGAEGMAVEDDARTLSASIPAVVSEVLVAVGDEVKINQKLILLESMKMVIPIQAPHPGLVTAIHCQSGDAVQPGVQLIEIEEES